MTPAPSERSRLLNEDDQQRNDGSKHVESQAAKSPAHRSTWFKATAIAALWTGSLLFAVDGSLVTTLATSIGSSFGKANLGPALGSTYLAGSCAFTPLYGRLSDLYGRRPLLLVAGTLFTVATLGCGVCGSMGELLFWRTVAGIGGGGLMSMSSVVMSDLISQRRRSLLQGASSVIFASGSALGGPVGGILNDTVGWRAAFLYQLPLCGLMLIVIAWRISIPLPFYDGTLTRRERLAKIDFYGSACIVVAVGSIAAGLQLGGNVYDWTHPLVIVFLVAGVTGLGVFLLVEGKSDKVPIIALDALFTRTVMCAFLANITGAIVVFCTIFQLPLYFLVAKGLSAKEAGLHYWPMSVALAVGSLVSGSIVSRTGRYKIPLLVATALTCVTPFLIAQTWDDDWPDNYWRYFVDIVWLGLGNGGAIAVLLVATISSVGHEQMATVTSINSFSRVFGQTLGVSLSGAIVQDRVKRELQSALAGRPDADALVDKIRTDIGSITTLPPDVRKIAVGAYRHGIHTLFWFVLGVAACSFLACVPIPQNELSTKAPLDEDEQDDDSDRRSR